MIEDRGVRLIEPGADPGTATIGGKASGLHRLSGAGLPVPPFCVVPAEATEDDIEGLAELIVARWPSSALAVRSSAVAEDSADASFAGQFDTVLDVRPTPSDVAAAVRTVRRSAGAEHVAAYGRGSDLDMAVLIMPMIEADAAGIAFTRHPVSGAEAVIIEAVHGIADRLAAGETAGERWSVDGTPVRETDLGVLSAGQATAVADLARRIEELEGSPQDIEWAIAGGRLHLLQARPITVLVDIEPIPCDDEIPPGYWEWDSTHSRIPASPLLADVFPEGMKRGSKLLAAEYGVPIDHLALRSINGYLYIQVMPMAGKPGSPPPPPPVMRVLFAVVPKFRRSEQAAARAFTRHVHRHWHDRWRTEQRPHIERRLSSWYDLDLPALSDEALAGLLAEVVELARETFAWNMVTDPAYLIPLTDLHRFLADQLGEGIETATRLLAGAGRSEYRMSVAALSDRLSAQVLSAIASAGDDLLERLEEVDPGFAGAYQDHLRSHGTRILGFDLIYPTQLENPNAELRRIATAPPERDPSRHAEELAAELADRLPESRRAEFERRVQEARRSYPMREEGEAVHASVLGRLRLVMLEIGRRLQDAGQVSDPNHTAFLTVDELVGWLHQRGEVSEEIRVRRGRHRWAATRVPPAAYGKPVPLPKPGSFPKHVARIMESIALLQAHDQRPAHLAGGADGVAASPGTYTGPVRVVRGPEDFPTVQEGDVLVAPVTTSPWEVLFPHIGALVTEGGGQLSHPAIVAREYGIPAIVGCEGATTTLTTGQIVTVDGTAGRIIPAG